MERKFTIIEEITRQYKRFNTVGTQLTVCLFPSIDGDERDPISYVISSVTDFC